MLEIHIITVATNHLQQPTIVIQTADILHQEALQIITEIALLLETVEQNQIQIIILIQEILAIIIKAAHQLIEGVLLTEVHLQVEAV